jgi:colanic acid biosynthesis glycosyl transferase WcaI
MKADVTLRASMNRLIFLNRYFFPDHSATSQILSDLARHLAASGREVHVITSQQLYDNAEAQLSPEETLEGVHIHRVFSTRFGRSALLGRGIDYVSFYASMWRSVSALAGRGDILVAMTDPPLTSVLAMRAAERRGARLVNWLQDIFPEVAIQLGIPFLKGPISKGLHQIRDASLKKAAANVVVGHRMAERVLARGAPLERLHLIPNWSEDDQIRVILAEDNPFRRAWGLEGKFVVGYSGNLGRAHEFHTILAASERLRSSSSIVFVIIGGGQKLDELARCVKERGLDHIFRFIPYQERASLKYSLSVPDVHWISLKPELEGLIVPSKFYGIAAASRPVIAITAADGEIALLVKKHECGLVIEPGNADALVEALAFLSKDRERTAAMGARARAMLDAHFTRHQSLKRWRDVLENISHEEQSGHVL